MKKILFSLLLVALVASGCGSKEEEKKETTVTVCTLDEWGMETEQEIIPDGRRIEKITMTITVKGASEAEQREGVKEVEEDYEGVEMQVSIDGDDIVMIISMEIDKLEELPPILGLDDSDIEALKEIKYKEYISNTEESGAICKEVTK